MPKRMAMPKEITMRDSTVKLDHSEVIQMTGLTGHVSIQMLTTPIVRREVTTMEAIVLTVLVSTITRVASSVLIVLVSTAMKVVNNVHTVLVSTTMRVASSVLIVLVSATMKVANSVLIVHDSIKAMEDIIMVSVPIVHVLITMMRITVSNIHSALVSTTMRVANSVFSALARTEVDVMESHRDALCYVRVAI
jgi:hypothetical protein